jgi:hypothetical protein
MTLRNIQYDFPLALEIICDKQPIHGHCVQRICVLLT